jgi:hypothetical protein
MKPSLRGENQAEPVKYLDATASLGDGVPLAFAYSLM